MTRYGYECAARPLQGEFDLFCRPLLPLGGQLAQRGTPSLSGCTLQPWKDADFQAHLTDRDTEARCCGGLA